MERKLLKGLVFSSILICSTTAVLAVKTGTYSSSSKTVSESSKSTHAPSAAKDLGVVIVKSVSKGDFQKQLQDARTKLQEEAKKRGYDPNKVTLKLEWDPIYEVSSQKGKQILVLSATNKNFKVNKVELLPKKIVRVTVDTNGPDMMEAVSFQPVRGAKYIFVDANGKKVNFVSTKQVENRINREVAKAERQIKRATRKMPRVRVSKTQVTKKTQKSTGS